MSPTTALSLPPNVDLARNAAIELSDHLPAPYAAPLIAHVDRIMRCADHGLLRLHAVRLADLLDEITEALTTRARGGS